MCDHFLEGNGLSVETAMSMRVWISGTDMDGEVENCIVNFWKDSHLSGPSSGAAGKFGGNDLVELRKKLVRRAYRSSLRFFDAGDLLPLAIRLARCPQRPIKQWLSFQK